MTDRPDNSTQAALDSGVHLSGPLVRLGPEPERPQRLLDRPYRPHVVDRMGARRVRLHDGDDNPLPRARLVGHEQDLAAVDRPAAEARAEAHLVAGRVVDARLALLQ